ncbi:MAG: SoxR reducing system RseC family protein [Lentimicrobium sp.]|nr:SoxR reducing system RseC family protein [Lentimicrobium sp.]
MTPAKDCIAKSGIIDHLDNQKIYVKILSISACASCQVQGVCSSSDMSEKIIEVDRNGAPDVKPGQLVNVSMDASNGNLAVVFGYLIPFVILILALVILVNFTSEGIAGLISIGLLAPYYAGLYLLKDRFQRKFRFTIEL